MAKWFRFKDKTPVADSSVMVSYLNKSSGKRVTQSIGKLNEYQIRIYKTNSEETYEYWWRYHIDTDFPPKSIEVGDVFVSKSNRTKSLTILAKYNKDYFVLKTTPDCEVADVYEEKDMLEYYERKE